MRTSPMTRALLPALVTLLAACSSVSPPAAPPVADVIYRNGYVYTADAERRVVQSVAVQGDRIVYLGSDAGSERWKGESTRLVDLHGRMLMPGLIDAHLHAFGVVQPDICDIGNQPMPLAGLVEFLRACIVKYQVSPGAWLSVPLWNFSEGNEPDARYPTLRAALDAVSTEHPILLFGSDGHHGAANSLALARARTADGRTVGYSRATLAKEFRDIRELVAVDAAGEPSGGLTESAKGRLGAPGMFGDMDYRPLLPKVASVFREAGITAVMDASTDPSQLALWRELEDSGQMTFRLQAALIRRSADRTVAPGIADIPARVQAFTEARARMQKESHLIRADHVKMFIDGVLEGNPLADPPTLPNGAALKPYLQPRFAGKPGSKDFRVAGYVDPKNPACKSAAAAAADAASAARFRSKSGFYPAQCEQSRGVLEATEEYFHAYESAMADAGFSVHAHAIGDRAVRVAVDLLEDAERRNPSGQHSIAHAQLIHPDDQARIGAAGIGVVFTHAWTVVNPTYDFSVIPFIEKVRDKDLYRDSYYMKNVYPTRGILKAGGIVASGSDAPVEDRNPRPFHNLEQAITRANPAGEYPGALNAAQSLDIHEAIASYTIAAARVLGMEAQIGSLEPGKKADMVMLDQNLVELVAMGDTRRISDTRVLRVVFDGKEVLDR